MLTTVVCGLRNRLADKKKKRRRCFGKCTWNSTKCTAAFSIIVPSQPKRGVSLPIFINLNLVNIYIPIWKRWMQKLISCSAESTVLKTQI